MVINEGAENDDLVFRAPYQVGPFWSTGRHLVRSSEDAAAASREDTSIGRVRMGLMLEVLMLGDGRARGSGEA
jgi:hypothetical protein